MVKKVGPAGLISQTPSSKSFEEKTDDKTTAFIKGKLNEEKEIKINNTANPITLGENNTITVKMTTETPKTSDSESSITTIIAVIGVFAAATFSIWHLARK